MAKQSKTSSTSKKADSPKKAKKEGPKETTKKEATKNGATKNGKNGSSEAPKKPRSAYILFSTDERQKLKTEKAASELDNKQVMGELAKRWKNAPDKVKAKYNKLAENDKER